MPLHTYIHHFSGAPRGAFQQPVYNKYKVRWLALAWFTSYLSNREFYVSNHMSDKATIASGVPEGSILGSLLFVIYMNDLPLHISNSNVELFADDATLYASGSTVNEVEQELGDETIH